MMDMLPMNGQKTYLLALAAGMVTAFMTLGYIDHELGYQILTFLGVGSVATLRHAISKSR